MVSFPVKIVLFHSYVSLSEGILCGFVWITEKKNGYVWKSVGPGFVNNCHKSRELGVPGVPQTHCNWKGFTIETWLRTIWMFGWRNHPCPKSTVGFTELGNNQDNHGYLECFAQRLTRVIPVQPWNLTQRPKMNPNWWLWTGLKADLQNVLMIDNDIELVVFIEN